jgi:hypothetical protein
MESAIMKVMREQRERIAARVFDEADAPYPRATLLASHKYLAAPEHTQVTFAGIKIIADPSMPRDVIELRGANTVRIENVGDGESKEPAVDPESGYVYAEGEDRADSMESERVRKMKALIAIAKTMPFALSDAGRKACAEALQESRRLHHWLYEGTAFDYSLLEEPESDIAVITRDIARGG